jgi:hypothetical protein
VRIGNLLEVALSVPEEEVADPCGDLGIEERLEGGDNPLTDIVAGRFLGERGRMLVALGFARPGTLGLPLGRPRRAMNIYR